MACDVMCIYLKYVELMCLQWRCHDSSCAPWFF